MSEAVAISEDALKLLVAEHGVRGTARVLGMDQTQTDAFRKRVERGRWMEDPAIAQKRALRSPTSVAAPIVAKVSPAQANAMEFQRLASESRLSLAKGMNSASNVIAAMPGTAIVADAGNVKSIVQATSQVFGWADQQPPSRMRLEVLLARPESHVDAIEIESTSQVVDSQWDDVGSISQDTGA